MKIISFLCFFVFAQNISAQELARFAIGRLEAKTDVELSVAESGLIQRVAVEESDWVKAGQVLIQLKSRQFKKSLDAVKLVINDQRSIDLLKSKVAVAKHRLDRIKQLSQSAGLASKSDVDSARAEYISAQYELESSLQRRARAKEEAKLWEIRIDDKAIRSPVSGVVVSIDKEVGEWIQPGESVVRIVALKPWYFVAPIPVSEIPSILSKNKFVVTYPSGSIDVTYSHSAPVISVESQTRKLYFSSLNDLPLDLLGVNGTLGY